MDTISTHHNPLLPQLLQQLHPLTSKVSPRAEARLEDMIASAVGDDSISSSTISHIMASRRCLPRKYVVRCADPTSPRAPVQLQDDLYTVVDTMRTGIADRQWLYATLITYIHTCIDPVDQPDLLPAVVPDMPSIDDVVALWCKTLWYAMCYDYAA